MVQNSQGYHYNRVLLKLSGEALAGDAGFGINQEIVDGIARQVAQLNADGVQLAIVIGGGNYFRGAKGSAAGMDRSLADSIGMMATVMNSLALQDAFERFGAPTAVLSAIEIQGVCETYSHRAAIAHLEAGHVVVFAAGTGRPYFTTDTAGALRACEIGAQALLKATKVDGVYDSDPVKNPNAVKFDRITYAEVLARDLRVMDAAATSLCKDNGVPVIVFNMFEEGNIARVLRGEAIGTTVE